jgi:hypothetical protein
LEGLLGSRFPFNSTFKKKDSTPIVIIACFLSVETLKQIKETNNILTPTLVDWSPQLAFPKNAFKLVCRLLWLIYLIDRSKSHGIDLDRMGYKSKLSAPQYLVKKMQGAWSLDTSPNTTNINLTGNQDTRIPLESSSFSKHLAARPTI